MKKLLTIVLVVLFVLCIGIAFIGCDNYNEGENEQGGVSEKNCNHIIGIDGVCSVCEEYIPTDGVVYRISEADEKNVEVCGYNGTARSVVIAREYNGLPVTTIAWKAFHNCDVSHVVLSNTITTIESYAFDFCKLTSIVLGESLTSVSQFAFSGCFRLVEIYNKSKLAFPRENAIIETGIDSYAKNIYNVPNGSKLVTDQNGYVIYTDGNERILIDYIGTETNLILPEDITKINGYAFYNRNQLTSIATGDGVTEIGEDAFLICNSLKTVVVGDGVVTIKSDAFAYCPNLSEIMLGKNLVDIEMWVFKGCKRLTKITVDEANTEYKSVDGDLYTKDGTELLQYAIGKAETTVTILPEVTRIGIGAFRLCDAVTDVVIGDHVLTVADRAFADCENLTSISFGKSVKYISDVAFEHTKLLNITVNEENTRYQAENGVLYSNENGKKSLRLYAARNTAETFVVPDDVYSIQRHAFERCTYLKNVLIGSNVTRIVAYAFNTCENLTSVNVASANTVVEKNAFFQCEKLTVTVLS